jgi:hypothetical protein
MQFMQSHGITLPFHREMADSSGEFAGPDVTAAVSFESYPRFIKGGFQDYEGRGIKRSTADSKHVPSPRSRLLGNNVFWSLPQWHANGASSGAVVYAVSDSLKQHEILRT